MQVTTDQLRNHLKQGIQSIYFVYGDEPLQIRDNTDMLRKAAYYYGFEEREVFNADRSFDWQQLNQAACEISLFSSKKLIEVYLPTGKPGDKGSKAIIDYCQNIVEDNILLLYTGELDGAVKRSKWFKQLQKSAVMVAVYPLKEQQLKNWLIKRLQKEELYCNNDAIIFLAELVEGNLLAADQEITKLSLLYGKGEVSLEKLFQAINDNARYKGFDLFDTVLKGQSKQVLSMLNSFQHDGTAITWLIFIMAKEIRMLAIISAHQKQMPLSAAMAKTYIFAQRKALIENVLRRLNKDKNSFSWQQSLIKLSEIDKQSKGVLAGDPWATLTTLLVGMASHIQKI
jgi:DNA polymerase-3 subunit delta